jgi:hypothetical protein
VSAGDGTKKLTQRSQAPHHGPTDRDSGRRASLHREDSVPGLAAQFGARIQIASRSKDLAKGRDRRVRVLRRPRSGSLAERHEDGTAADASWTEPCAASQAPRSRELDIGLDPPNVAPTARSCAQKRYAEGAFMPTISWSEPSSWLSARLEKVVKCHGIVVLAVVRQMKQQTEVSDRVKAECCQLRFQFPRTVLQATVSRYMPPSRKDRRS